MILVENSLPQRWLSESFYLSASRGVGNFAIREKGGNRLVPGLDYLVNALKLHNQVPRGSASNGPVVDSRDLNLVFGNAEATPNKLFLSSPIKYTVEPYWPLILIKRYWCLAELFPFLDELCCKDLFTPTVDDALKARLYLLASTTPPWVENLPLSGLLTPSSSHSDKYRFYFVLESPIIEDEDILECVQSSKNIIDAANSEDETEMNNPIPILTSPEMMNFMESMRIYTDAYSKGVK
ncbi:hypothetical protein TNCV_2854111 [Trichonephila clavipes]|uniref:Uncharacterized protein n=1 Tax=Trichonephila clavipes TaxID=2585209 RepID=A0A8X6RGL6_TRICX|nr:hypothetical protein TNCV_2854111 [Trichonephila clavipes]